MAAGTQKQQTLPPAVGGRVRVGTDIFLQQQVLFQFLKALHGVVAETEENGDTGLHPLGLKERSSTQLRAGGLEGSKVRGGGPGEAEQGRPESSEGGWRGRRARRVVGGHVGASPVSVHATLSNPERERVVDGEPRTETGRALPLWGFVYFFPLL